MKREIILIAFLLNSAIVIANPDTSKVNESPVVESKKENSKIPDYLIYTVITFIGVTLGGVWVKYVFERTVKQVEADYTEKMKEKLKDVNSQIAKAFNDKQENVDKILEKADNEKILLKTKKILIWGEADNTIIKRVLRNIGFNITDNLFEEEKDGLQYDILIINNKSGTLVKDKDTSKLLLKAKDHLSNEKICIFYYNSTLSHFPIGEIDESMQDRINFATNAAQIYGNLLNTLKYQDKISKS